MNVNFRESEVLSGAEPRPADLDNATGTLVSFLPAHGNSKAGVVAKQLGHTLTEGFGLSVLLADFENRGNSVWQSSRLRRRLDGRTWGAFVHESRDLKVLDACEVNPRDIAGLMEYARENYSVVCADLTGARESHTIELLNGSQAIFMVTGSDQASLEAVREKADRLRSAGLLDCVALLLENTSAEFGPAEVEEFTGLPVCGMVETKQQIEQLARWIASNARPVDQEMHADFALAG